MLEEVSPDWWGKEGGEKIPDLAIEDKSDEKEPTKDDSSDDEAQSALTSIPGPGTWIISIPPGSRCLHVVGNCHRQPGAHYHNWLEVKPGVKEELFKKTCKVCFRLGYPLFSHEQPEEVDEALADGMPEEAAIEDGESPASG